MRDILRKNMKDLQKRVLLSTVSLVSTYCMVHLPGMCVDNVSPLFDLVFQCSK